MGSKSTEVNEEIAKQLERAKAALAVSKAKMEAQEQAEAGLLDDDEEEEKKEKNNDEAVPFFAMNAEDENGKKEKVIKEKNEDGGFTTDGDLMAKLSEEEEWESRPLLEVFQNEEEKTAEAMNIDRDIGQSMYNLRKSLQTEDFMKIFDKRNRFIGDAWVGMVESTSCCGPSSNFSLVLHNFLREWLTDWMHRRQTYWNEQEYPIKQICNRCGSGHHFW